MLAATQHLPSGRPVGQPSHPAPWRLGRVSTLLPSPSLPLSPSLRAMGTGCHLTACPLRPRPRPLTPAAPGWPGGPREGSVSPLTTGKACPLRSRRPEPRLRAQGGPSGGSWPRLLPGAQPVLPEGLAPLQPCALTPSSLCCVTAPTVPPHRALSHWARPQPGDLACFLLPNRPSPGPGSALPSLQGHGPSTAASGSWHRGLDLKRCLWCRSPRGERPLRGQHLGSGVRGQGRHLCPRRWTLSVKLWAGGQSRAEHGCELRAGVGGFGRQTRFPLPTAQPRGGAEPCGRRGPRS